MKKIILLFILLLSNYSFATTFQISGLDNVPNASKFDYENDFYWGSIPNIQHSHSSSNGLPREIFDMFFKSMSDNHSSHQLAQDPLSKKDSTLTIKFLGYPNACHVVFSNKSHVTISINEDGSCLSS